MTGWVEVNIMYLCGPMAATERDDMNYPAFHEVEQAVAEQGWSPLNPARFFGGDTTRPYSDYMRASVEAVLQSNALLALPGWDGGVGSRVEVYIALAIGLPIYEWSAAGIRPLYPATAGRPALRELLEGDGGK